MSIFQRPILETQDGVFDPPIPLRHRVIVSSLSLFLAIACVFVFLEKRSLFPMLICWALGLSLFNANQWYMSRKYGTQGRPYLAFMGDELVITCMYDSRGALSLALDSLECLVVYGMSKGRIYRLVRRDGTFVEVRPMWGRGVEKAVIAFLQRTHRLPVTIQEPQTVFASIRGDGPY